MNWASNLINELDKYYHKAHDQGYEFHFNWILMLITFVSWKILEGENFLEIEPLDLLEFRFSTLWYTNDMSKQ